MNYGADQSAFTSAPGIEIIAPTEPSLCKNDVAYVVLAQPLAQVFVPLRLAPVHVGERFRFSGWGITRDYEATPPSRRFSLDDLRVDEVGPGLIPPGTFAIAGNTLCYGDSGGGARFNGALAGVAAFMNKDYCSLTAARVGFSELSADRALIDRAFAAAGRTPWFEGEPAPWLAKDGASCGDDASCASGLCVNGRCAPSCGSGAACRDGTVCISGACSAPTPSADAGADPGPPPSAGGCSASSSRRGPPCATLLALSIAVLRSRRRRRSA